MLEIVLTASDRIVLEKSKLFNKDDILEFCLLLSYGKFSKNFYQSKRKIYNPFIYVEEELNNLNDKLKNYKDIRIWYSKIDNEEMCNLCFLVNYLSNLNKNIFVCEVSQKGYKALGGYDYREIKDFFPLTQKLTNKEINIYKTEWEKLYKENSEIRRIKDGKLISDSFKFIDSYILNKMPDNDEIKYITLVVDCLIDKTNYFSFDSVFQDRINRLIKKGDIVITKEVDEINKIGELRKMKYIKKNTNYFKYTLDNKRYHTLNYYYKNKYNSKMFKVSLNTGLSCPNKINGKGCIFCSDKGSGDFAGNSSDNVIKQFNEVKEIMHKKWPNAKYIGYFQANTNTFAPVSKLKEFYEPILQQENVVGLNIATRSDAINNECLEYLIDLNKRTDLTIELGLQSIHETTLKYINRGHTLKNFTECVKKLKDNNIKVVVHIINGLPYETKEMMLETVKYLNALHIDGIKIHMLHILKNTELANRHEKEQFPILTKEEYIDIVINQLEYLDKNIIVHRITGDPKLDDLIEPKWLLKKFCVLNDIDKEMVKRDTYQGKRVN